MRLVLASQQYPPETADGGIGTQTYAKAHGLAARGHEVVVVSHSPDGVRREYRDGAVDVIRLPGFDDQMPMHTVEAWWLTYSALVAAEIARLHRLKPVDLVDFPEYGAEGFVWLLNRPVVDRVPTVVHLHGPLAMLSETIGWPEPESEFCRTARFLEGTCLRLADAVFSSSRCSADWCTRAYGVARESIPVLHTGIDVTHFSPRPARADAPPTVIFVGRVTESKGVTTLVEALLQVVGRVPGVQLKLVGRAEDEYRERIQQMAVAAGCPDLIEFAGYKDRSELPEVLSTAQVFAAPSMYEGGPGFVYLEAMACGLPVVACAGSGASEAVSDGVDGFLVPPGHSDALAERLLQLLTDRSVRSTMSAAARTNAVAHANSVTCLAGIDAFYQTVAGRQWLAGATPQVQR
jgi:glycosyltransferase involved in cell wall biosynthesis